MPYEILKDPRGSTTDSEGVPYNETLTQREGRRGMFWRWRLKRKPEDHGNTTPVPNGLKEKQPTRKRGSGGGMTYKAGI